MLNIIKIVGDSMSPTLDAGDFVCVWRRIKSINVGDLVVCDHPKYKRLIKRVAAIDLDGRCLLEGDNPQSLSSEKMGWFSLESLYGKVIFKIKK